MAETNVEVPQFDSTAVFISDGDPRDGRTWSGTTGSILRAIDPLHQQVVTVHGGPGPARMVGQIRNALAHLKGRRVAYVHGRAVAKARGRQASRVLEGLRSGIVWAIGKTTEIAHVQTNLPKVYTSDATFELLTENNWGYQDQTPSSIRECEEVERRGLNHADVLLLATQWAADSAVDTYGVDPGDVEVIPYGANLPAWPEDLRVGRPEPAEPVKLVFIGAGWERKGGPIALGTARWLNSNGTPVELHIIGDCPPDVRQDPVVRNHGFLSKQSESDFRIFEEILRSANFMLLPTRCECFGIAFCEANAFGVPAITNDVGGVSCVVRDGINGHVLPDSSAPADYGRLIRNLWNDTERYMGLRKSSREEFECRLNWTEWTRRASKAVANRWPDIALLG